ncbi:hypothetical protein MNBD_GAMMA10-1314, partial [hydrothermal vent metagenome]
LEERVYSDIIDSFRMYADKAYISDNEARIDKILFSYPGDGVIPPGFEALGYGWAGNREIFDGCGGFDLSDIFKVSDAYYENHGDNETYDSLTENCGLIANALLEYCFEKACQSTAFIAVCKASSVVFLFSEEGGPLQAVYTYGEQASEGGPCVRVAEKDIRKKLKDAYDDGFLEVDDFINTVRMVSGIENPSLGLEGLAAYMASVISNAIIEFYKDGESGAIKTLFDIYLSEFERYEDNMGADRQWEANQNICANMLALFPTDKEVTDKVLMLVPEQLSTDMLAFNVACVHNFNGNREQALVAISQARALGVSKGMLLDDDMLASFKGDEAFDKIFT